MTSDAFTLTGRILAADAVAIMEWFRLSHEQVAAVIEFAARSLDAPRALQQQRAHGVDAHTL